MAKQECGNCRFFIIEPADKGLGCCRRYPPIRVADVTGEIEEGTGYIKSEIDTFRQPGVFPEEWCGEWKAKR